MKNKHATGVLQGSINHNRELLLYSLLGLYFIMLLIHGYYHGTFTFNEAFGHSSIGYVVAFVLAVAVQVVRFVLVITGTKEIGRGGAFGFIGMAFSLAITIYLAMELPHVAEWWSKGNDKKMEAMNIVTQMLNWFGWILEIMLVASVSRDLKEEKKDETSTYEETDAERELRLLKAQLEYEAEDLT